MRLIDLLILPVAALWQQKLRTVLTTLGVVFGAFVLAASLSIGEGVQEAVARESHRNEVARRIDVFSKAKPVEVKAGPAEVKVDGTMSDARRGRLRKMLAADRQQATSNQTIITLSRARLAKLAAIPHVSRVIPVVYNSGFALFGAKSTGTAILSARPDDETGRRRVVAGRYFETPNERSVVISEYLAYRLGVVNDSDIDGLIGKPLRLEFSPGNFKPGFEIYLRKSNRNVSREERSALDKIMERLPKSLEKFDLNGPEIEVLRKSLSDQAGVVKRQTFSEDFTVIGVIRPPSDEELKAPDFNSIYADVLLPYQTAADLYFRMIGSDEEGVHQAIVLVDEEKEVKDVVKQILEIGVEGRSAIEFIERQQLIYLLLFGAMTCVAGVALLVSGLGIANTILMSVLERQREIGIMKAVGADNRHLQFIFLVEGGLIGLVGAAIGFVLAWAASFPADAWVRSMVLRDIKIDLKGSLFVFPTWIGLTVMVFTVLVTTLAAFYPARHAARVDPVKALRHE